MLSDNMDFRLGGEQIYNMVFRLGSSSFGMSHSADAPVETCSGIETLLVRAGTAAAVPSSQLLNLTSWSWAHSGKRWVVLPNQIASEFDVKKHAFWKERGDILIESTGASKDEPRLVPTTVWADTVHEAQNGRRLAALHIRALLGPKPKHLNKEEARSSVVNLLVLGAIDFKTRCQEIRHTLHWQPLAQ